MPKSEIDSLKTKTPQTKVRRDLIAIGVVVLISCALVLRDPGRIFEWMAGRREVQFDEFMVAMCLLGGGLAIFSWRRWSDLSRQVAEYQRVQVELSTLHQQALLMSETDDLLQACLSPAEAYGIAIRHLEMQFPAMSGAIFTVSDDQKTAELSVSWGAPALRHNPFALEECWAVRRGRLYRTLAADPRLGCSHVGPTLPGYALCVPMMAQGETLGILYMDNGAAKSDGTALTQTEERIVRILAEHLALAAANLKLRETLRVEAIRDPLTGLFNRRYMEESLEREFRRAVRRQNPLAVLMIDIDHFKRFNDSYGHEAGDAVLRDLAKTVQAQVRAEDIASRYGGEEFILILPETEMDAARECAERIRAAAGSMQIQMHGKTLERIRLSIGIAWFPQHGSSAELLVRAADGALYRAKENGRDQVVIAGQPQPV